MPERLIPLSEAADLLPKELKLSVLRCVTTGRRGVLLEAVLVADGLRTTREAAGRFVENTEER